MLLQVILLLVLLVLLCWLLGATPLQIELELLRISDHVSKTTSAGHIAAFYRPWEDVRADKFDGLIITGAPVEQIGFEEVTYWDELRRILDWSQSHVHRTLTLCWGARQTKRRHAAGVSERACPLTLCRPLRLSARAKPR